MSRIAMGWLMSGVLLVGLFTPPVSAQNTTTALKAKGLAGEKLAPPPKAKPKSKAASKRQAKNKGKKKPPRTLQQQADKLQVKSEALSQMADFLTDRRARAQKRVEMMTAYLQSIDKLQDYENSQTPPPSNEGEMSYRQAVNTAIQHVKKQGTTTYVDNPDQAEVKLLRRVCNANDRLTQKTWKEFTVFRDQIRSMGEYLKSIGKVEDYKKWAGVEVDKQVQARQRQRQADRRKEVAAYKKKHAREKKEQKQQAEKIAAERRQDRHEAMRMQFQLRQQELYNQMRRHTATGNSWCEWGDPYDDVYHHRPY